MTKQLNLFADVPPPSDKPMQFKPAQRPIWTEDKAKLIERYLYYFVMITKHGAYIDGFAGPQYVGKPDAWAAKLVLESKPAFLRNFWLCEIKPQKVKMLEALRASQPAIKNRTIDIVAGDFNKNVMGLLASSGIADKAATFCLLDQHTFECEWKTLVTLSRHRADYKIELFYFLASGWLDRAMSGIKDTSILERWWGGSDYGTMEGISGHARMHAFCERFKSELGYKHAFGWPIHSKKVGGRVMYHMIHATDHDEGPLLMNRAYLNALKRREPIDRLQRDLKEIWGNTGSGEKPKRQA
jgi:three-Cys-motif partner protein